MGAKYSKMCASSCVVFGERILGSVTVSGPVSVSHGILYKVEWQREYQTDRKVFVR